MTTPLLQVDGLTVSFSGRRGNVLAVRDVSLRLNAGEILGVVGESGAGKSTIGAAVLGLVDSPGRVEAGSIRLNGDDLSGLSQEDWETIRGRRIGMIMQDPLTSLNPLYTIGKHLIETISITRNLSASAAVSYTHLTLPTIA